MQPEYISDGEAMTIIYEILDGVEWSADTLEAIASIVMQAGYNIRNPHEVEA
jgi:hypothetical protein